MRLYCDNTACKPIDKMSLLSLLTLHECWILSPETFMHCGVPSVISYNWIHNWLGICTSVSCELLCRPIHICAKIHLQPLFALIHSVLYNAVTPKLMRFFWCWSCHFISIYVLILKIITNYDQMDLSNKLKFHWKIAGTECTVSVFWEEESLHRSRCYGRGV